MIHIEDAGQLRNLEYDLSRAPLRIQWAATAALRDSSLVVEKGMTADASGHRFLPHLQKSVTAAMLTPMVAEIGLGPRAGTQGSLAHIIVYGNVKYPGTVRNRPVWDHTDVLRRSAPAIDRIFGDRAQRAALGE